MSEATAAGTAPAPDEGSIALTFDDGPDPVWTSRLLDVLARARATATFFPIAPRAQRNPALVSRILAGGHTIGLHCDEHVRHADRDEAWLRRDTARALDRLRGLGVTATRWRTPWGQAAPFTAGVAADQRLALTGWTVDTHDWRGDRADDMFAATRSGLRPGAVVLAHDGIGPGARRTDPRETVMYVERVSAWASDNGVSLRSL